jgi:2-oxoglutarate dehydrogenase E2 component (dihydrolipoamide succinyltransferase)
MATEIKVPTVGESITEGAISRWFKKDGETVRVDEPLFELETEKATTEVAAPAAGTLHIRVPEGQTVPIGAVVGQIDEKASAPAAKTKEEKAARAARSETPAGDGSPARATAAGGSVRPGVNTPGSLSGREGEKLLSPAARRLADENGIDVQQLAGTGPRGRITKEDVLHYVAQNESAPDGKNKRPAPSAPSPSSVLITPPAPPPPAEKPAAPAAGRETRQRMTSIRQRIAERLVDAQHHAAILTTFNEADLSAVMALRHQYTETFQKKHSVGLGFMAFFVKAAIEALRAYPVVNACIDGSDIVYHHYYNIGVAVSTERGLMVPVLGDADRMSFADIERHIAELAQRARDGKITVQDLQGGTFTITNGGIFGSLLSTPILNPPQSAILGMHSIQKRPVVKDDQIVIRPMMYLALSYDHRLIDGRDAVLFLVRIKECIENPERLLLEV